MRVVSSDMHKERGDALSQDWTNFFAKNFPRAILVPILNNPNLALQTLKDLKIEAMVFSNGNSFGESNERDETETRVFDYCIKKRLPILGVCRGFQVLNHFFGGKIEKNISEITGEKHAGVVHEITIEEESPYAKFAKSNLLIANSFHDQGVIIKDISKSLKVFATTKSGVVEGLYHPTKPIVGIQWHPERTNPSHDFDVKIINSLFKI